MKKKKMAYKKPSIVKESQEDEMPVQKKKRKGAMKMTPVSKGHKPNGAHGRAAVKALGRTKTTGNFAKIEKAKGKGAAIAAYQDKLHAHQMGKKSKGGMKSGSMAMLSRGMRGMKK